jgi:hypothetical protein
MIDMETVRCQIFVFSVKIIFPASLLGSENMNEISLLFKVCVVHIIHTLMYCMHLISAPTNPGESLCSCVLSTQKYMNNANSTLFSGTSCYKMPYKRKIAHRNDRIFKRS